MMESDILPDDLQARTSKIYEITETLRYNADKYYRE